MTQTIAHNPFENDMEPNKSVCIPQVIEEMQEHSNGEEFDESEFVSLDMEEIQATESGKIDCEHPKEILAGKQAQLKQKEMELRKLEKELQQKYANQSITNTHSLQIDTNANIDYNANNKRIPNWPHAKWAYLYHDIAHDIPEEMQKLVSGGYNLWKLTAIGYIMNLIAVGCASFHDNYYESGMSKSQAVFTSLLWVAIIIPIGFLLWYMNLYRIARKFKTTNWLIFTVSFGCHLIFASIILSGCPWYPCAGFFFTMTCFFSGLTLSTIFGVLNCVVWVFVVALSLSVYREVRNTFGNVSIEKQAPNQFKNALASIVPFAV